MREDFGPRAGAQCRDAGLELRGRCVRPERKPRRAEIHGESADGRDDPRSRRSLRRAFQRALDQGLNRKAVATRRIDDGADG